MAEPVKDSIRPMKELQELLQDERLRAEVANAEDEGAILQIVNEAGKDKGYQFTDDWMNGLLDDVKLNRTLGHIGEDELMELASTFNVADTAPKLCHTDSCGGTHGGCC